MSRQSLSYNQLKWTLASSASPICCYIIIRRRDLVDSVFYMGFGKPSESFYRYTLFYLENELLNQSSLFCHPHLTRCLGCSIIGLV